MRNFAAFFRIVLTSVKHFPNLEFKFHIRIYTLLYLCIQKKN